MKEKWKMYLLLIMPWLSVIKLGKSSFIRYLPTIVFSDLIIAIISELSRELKWWKVKNPIFPKLATDVSFVFGPFTILNLWIFKLTYKKFWLYLLTNIISDYLFAYPLTSLAEKLGVYKMVKMSRKQLFLLCVAVAIINYLYQTLIVEKQRSEQSIRNNEP
ncbi:hypothetical protein [Metabacillus halosaccharovorans]|uniref:hypothetical protein n=1 Tax=Metabacillus halosaccharovorans TaxID=930124 RepID=UPI00203C50D3|nr:hypothetical protein [Metabacillus halosaccharovorans]MCM3439430.1 hypothetical protein [Metabacillus halosaccharovorans]